MSGRISVYRSRASRDNGRWIVMDDTSLALVGSFAAGIHFATRLTTQPRQEQAMTMTPVIQPNVEVLALERVLALAEHALKIDPSLESANEERRAIDTVRDAANEAWLGR